jgi:hypothetical protein
MKSPEKIFFIDEVLKKFYNDKFGEDWDETPEEFCDDLMEFFKRQAS